MGWEAIRGASCCGWGEIDGEKPSCLVARAAGRGVVGEAAARLRSWANSSRLRPVEDETSTRRAPRCSAHSCAACDEICRERVASLLVPTKKIWRHDGAQRWRS